MKVFSVLTLCVALLICGTSEAGNRVFVRRVHGEAFVRVATPAVAVRTQVFSSRAVVVPTRVVPVRVVPVRVVPSASFSFRLGF